MPNMRVCKSTGAILFSPTKQEKEIIDLKKELKSELQEMKELKEQMQKLVNRSEV